ncbi:transposase domain-containing protein [uncultured Sphaerochaeta sp.]|uniref:transposase domain-containing protein n=1 Tax=uncultured Sphaerochaeta sp. TaxID=886478 RepID=UPI00374A901A
METAKANGINVHDYIWHILSEVPEYKTDEDFDRLLPWNVDNDSLMRMRNTRDSGKPDPTRAEPYVFRGVR